MNRITRLLRPVPQRTPSVASAVLAAALPALAVACALGASPAQADTRSAKPNLDAVIDFNHCSKPVWPAASLAAKETGKVTLKFLVEADGSVTDSRVLKSSGHPALDEAAQEGIRKCRFIPARKGDTLVKSWVAVQYVWTLE